MIDVCCVLAAFCFCISNLLGAIIVAHERTKKDHFDFEAFLNLESDYLETQWETRRADSSLLHATGIFNAVAWFLLAIPIIQLAWILSRGGRRQVGLHTAIVCLALGAAIVELLSKMLLAGVWRAASWISQDFQLDGWTVDGTDGIGWKTLELTYLMTQGMVLWVDAFEWVALFGILIMVFFSVGTTADNKHSFGKWWPTFGLIIAFLSFIDFAADILRLEEWRTFTSVAMVITAINSIFLLPVWILMLGKLLPRGMPQYADNVDDGFYVRNVEKHALTSPVGPPPSFFLPSPMSDIKSENDDLL